MNEMINRRTLLQVGGALVVAFSLPIDRTRAAAVGGKTVSTDRVDGLLAVARDGRVTVYSGKVDLGTGVRTALTQIVADELDGPMQDFKVQGMLHGRVLRPAGFGATVVSYDESSIAEIPGIVRVVHISNFLGIVAQSEWSAIQAAQQLKVTWSNWNGLPEQSKIWE